jgi:hypothetical protein
MAIWDALSDQGSDVFTATDLLGLPNVIDPNTILSLGNFEPVMVFDICGLITREIKVSVTGPRMRYQNIWIVYEASFILLTVNLQGGVCFPYLYS